MSQSAFRCRRFSGGSDPTSTIEAAARALGLTFGNGMLHNISTLGSGHSGENHGPEAKHSIKHSTWLACCLLRYKEAVLMLYEDWIIFNHMPSLYIIAQFLEHMNSAPWIYTSSCFNRHHRSQMMFLFGKVAWWFTDGIWFFLHKTDGMICSVFGDNDMFDAACHNIAQLNLFSGF